MSEVDVLCRTFFRVLSEITGKKGNMELKGSFKLENALYNYLIKTIGFKNSYLEQMKEVEIAFENIIINSKKEPSNLISNIEQYGDEYVALLDSHPLTKLFIESVNEISSPKFDIKHVGENDSSVEYWNIAIRHIGNRLDLFHIPRRGEETLPTIVINHIDEFERVLENYIFSIQESNTFYNIFNREAFSYQSKDEKIKMIFEGALLNVSNTDAEDVTKFFQHYTDYINDDTFLELHRPSYVGAFEEDELYVMAKRSELWYETPYYLSFMLKDRRLELPNVRLGISFTNSPKVANIVATQTAQQMKDNIDYTIFSEKIKSSIPKDSTFRFINPAHIPSLILTFGLLKGCGINEVIVKDYLPFRYKKVMQDRQFSDEEGENYQRRLTDKTLSTMFRSISMMEGIEILSYPESIYELHFFIEDGVTGKNEFLTNLYNLGLQKGKELTKQKSFCR